MAEAVPIRPEEERPPEQKSTVDLIREIVDDSRLIIQREFQLLRQEINDLLGKLAVATAVMLVGAVFLVLGAGYLGATAILALSLAITPWLSALIVTLVFLAVGGLMLGYGLRTFGRAKFAPRTMDTLKEDAEWLRHPTGHREK